MKNENGPALDVARAGMGSDRDIVCIAGTGSSGDAALHTSYGFTMTLIQYIWE